MDIVKNIFYFFLAVVAIVGFFKVVITMGIIPIREGIVEANILKKGIAVNADIISVNQTEYWGGNKPICAVTVRYKTKEGIEYTSTVKKALDVNEVKHFVAGNGTTIKYHPEKPKNIAIYDRPLILD
ncbi:hypothetical protein PMPD1_0832 [Paramixta manurensis]|uniref:DUF3592 domain-containing protein n=1 Tax=Paramixta manurensis TaxID=2740817 RepID=A0A6M8U8I7_9GAMM|nr:hypothetical protein PMPD1_0832 [Erwiniaceae bacterium PD-1]